jgi:hypothetical protein
MPKTKFYLLLDIKIWSGGLLEAFTVHKKKIFWTSEEWKCWTLTYSIYSKLKRLHVSEEGQRPNFMH